MHKLSTCFFSKFDPYVLSSLTLEIVSVDPVENVKPSVRSQGKEIVRSDGFGLTGLLHHKQLRQNGNGLQVNGEGP